MCAVASMSLITAPAPVALARRFSECTAIYPTTATPRPIAGNENFVKHSLTSVASSLSDLIKEISGGLKAIGNTSTLQSSGNVIIHQRIRQPLQRNWSLLVFQRGHPRYVGSRMTETR